MPLQFVLGFKKIGILPIRNNIPERYGSHASACKSFKNPKRRASAAAKPARCAFTAIWYIHGIGHDAVPTDLVKTIASIASANRLYPAADLWNAAVACTALVFWCDEFFHGFLLRSRQADGNSLSSIWHMICKHRHFAMRVHKLRLMRNMLSLFCSHFTLQYPIEFLCKITQNALKQSFICIIPQKYPIRSWSAHQIMHKNRFFEIYFPGWKSIYKFFRWIYSRLSFLFPLDFSCFYDIIAIKRW